MRIPVATTAIAGLFALGIHGEPAAAFTNAPVRGAAVECCRQIREASIDTVNWHRAPPARWHQQTKPVIRLQTGTAGQPHR
jgi:hypothetical protein